MPEECCQVLAVTSPYLYPHYYEGVTGVIANGLPTSSFLLGFLSPCPSSLQRDSATFPVAHWALVSQVRVSVMAVTVVPAPWSVAALEKLMEP